MGGAGFQKKIRICKLMAFMEGNLKVSITVLYIQCNNNFQENLHLCVLSRYDRNF